MSSSMGIMSPFWGYDPNATVHGDAAVELVDFVVSTQDSLMNAWKGTRPLMQDARCKCGCVAVWLHGCVAQSCYIYLFLFESDDIKRC
jgi:hypothetical protein